MSVGKSSFLKLYRIDPSLHFTKKTTIYDVSEELLKVDLEHSRDNVRTITGLLIWIEIFMDFFPIWIAGKSYKQVRFTLFYHDGHSVVISLPHIS